MVVDFKWIKLAIGGLLDRLDHALCINSLDPLLKDVRKVSQRIVTFDGVDPTTEILARYIFDHLQAKMSSGDAMSDAGGRYTIDPNIRLERVRVWETATTWAEYARE
jgi:6-pyruvoyltetrahydropterin/6-carboxytetrahydropterin synthase